MDGNYILELNIFEPLLPMRKTWYRPGKAGSHAVDQRECLVSSIHFDSWHCSALCTWSRVPVYGPIPQNIDAMIVNVRSFGGVLSCQTVLFGPIEQMNQASHFFGWFYDLRFLRSKKSRELREFDRRLLNRVSQGQRPRISYQLPKTLRNA